MLNVQTYNGFELSFDFPRNMEPGYPLDNVEVTPTTAVVHMSTGSRFELYGTDFTYDPSTISATGKVDKVLYFQNGILMAEANGTDVDAAHAFALAKQYNGGALVLRYLLEGADRYELSSGNDDVWNSDGSDTVIGGDGIDQVRYFGHSSQYQLSRNAEGTVFVKDASGDVDTLISVEQIQFTDKMIGPHNIPLPVNPNGTFSGGGGFTFDAGDGVDTMTYDGARASYSFTRTGETVTVNLGADLANILSNVERLKFTDGVLALDTEGNAGQAYRLYQAAFERTPDNDGLKYWIERLDSGDTNLTSIADSFLNSPEFIRKFGTETTVSNGSFVELLYTHTLGRDYDKEGYDYWVGELDAGTTNRRDLLSFFSESNENKAKVADAIDDGIWLI